MLAASGLGFAVFQLRGLSPGAAGGMGVLAGSLVEVAAQAHVLLIVICISDVYFLPLLGCVLARCCWTCLVLGGLRSDPCAAIMIILIISFVDYLIYDFVIM